MIEVAPLAFMRGRTLNEAFIILDEAQNTTIEQMKMFLTRIGFGSRTVVTGDITQVDLPRVQTLRSARCGGTPARHARGELHFLHRRRCGAPSPGAAHRDGLRAAESYSSRSPRRQRR